MSQKFSRAEKEKWVTGTNKPARRSPVRIPESDNSSLIEANKFTLIGRVTNPLIQKPRAVVSYFPQFWNLDSVVSGRDLGRDRFLFKFETEEALQSILRKGPYHYKRWMLILQRWEPIASDLFPALLTFWVKIHGLPVHQWTPQTIRTIGSELGQITGSEAGIDAENGRIRVQVNGLEPLEMTLPIRMPAGEVITVELEYEKLEKHCFTCFSLLHEESDCPRLKGKPANPLRVLGINQQKTLLKLEAEKQKSDLRRGVVRHASSNLIRDSNPRPSPVVTHRESNSHHHQTRRFSPGRGREHGKQRRSPQDFSPNQNSRYPSYHHRDNRSPNNSARHSRSRPFHSDNYHSQAHYSHTPYHKVPYSKDPSPARTGVSGAHTPVQSKPSSPSPRPAGSAGKILSSKGKEIASYPSRSRRPALERIAQNTSPEVQPRVAAVSSNSNRLQEVAIQYLEDTNHFGGTTNDPGESSKVVRSTSHLPLEARLSFPTTSQNSQLQETRIHTSLRLGPQVETVTVTIPTAKPDNKTTRKRKTAAERALASALPRGARSPLKGASLKKQGIIRTRGKQSPKKRLRTDNLPEIQDSSPPPPPPVMIPAITKNGVDFQSNPHPLP